MKFAASIIFLSLLSVSGLALADSNNDVCQQFSSADGAVLLSQLNGVDTRSCTADSDCQERSSTSAYLCGAMFNKAGAEIFDKYLAGPVHQTLEEKFQALGCHHIYPPCPFPGVASCQNNRCVGALPH